jgi:UDP-4-amino-4,6-dideoxy-L-N-acetyl-beta-L-altrosamine transaminase
MTRPFIPYAKQSIDETDLEAVTTALKGTWITRGPQVEAFEEAVAKYCNAKYAVAFNNATSGLIAACRAAQVTAHDRLITTPNSFVASTIAGMHHGAIPIFVDIDRNTGNMNLKQVIDLLKQPLTRGKYIVLPVHFSGIPVDMQLLDDENCDPDAIIIEDAAHALGSTYADGQKVGSCAYSQMTVFSFHPAKTITTGEGGMVTTNDEELYLRLKLFRNNGMEKNPERFEIASELPYEGYYEVLEMAGNYNFTDFQAALGISQLRRIDQMVAKRRELVSTYRDLLRDVPHLKMFTDAMDEHVAFHLFVVQIDFEAYGISRSQLMSSLKERGIGTQFHYIPIYRHPFLERHSGDISEYFPNMEGYYSQAVTLPLYYDLSVEDVEFVTSTLKEILQHNLEHAQKPDKHSRHRHVRRLRR